MVDLAYFSENIKPQGNTDSMKKSIKCELDKYLCYATELSLTTCKNFIVLCWNALALMIPFLLALSLPSKAEHSALRAARLSTCTVCHKISSEEQGITNGMSVREKEKGKIYRQSGVRITTSCKKFNNCLYNLGGSARCTHSFTRLIFQHTRKTTAKDINSVICAYEDISQTHAPISWDQRRLTAEFSTLAAAECSLLAHMT